MEKELKNKLEKIIRDFHNKGVLLPDDFAREYFVKRKKLPRKLKKQYKKENKFVFEATFFDSI